MTMSALEVKVPPIGDFKDVPIIEVLVKPGDQVAADAPLVTLESEKATMDVPAPASGVVRELTLKVGDRVVASGPEDKDMISAETPGPVSLKVTPTWSSLKAISSERVPPSNFMASMAFMLIFRNTSRIWSPVLDSPGTTVKMLRWIPRARVTSLKVITTSRLTRSDARAAGPRAKDISPSRSPSINTDSSGRPENPRAGIGSCSRPVVLP